MFLGGNYPTQNRYTIGTHTSYTSKAPAETLACNLLNRLKERESSTFMSLQKLFTLIFSPVTTNQS